MSIKEFWDNSVNQINKGRHSDSSLEQLETWFITKYGLIEYKNINIFDMGCGEGTRTRLIASYATNTIGIDYSKPLIHLATKYTDEDRGISFKCLDITNYPQLNLIPDIIISCRFLINLPNEKTVIETLEWFYQLLPIGGKLILLEGSQQGHNNLNNLRKRLSLPEIKTVWHNINLNESNIESWLKGKFTILHKSRLGLYYTITRGFIPSSSKSKTPIPFLNQIASDMQRDEGIGILEDYGRHYCLILQKL